VPVATSVGLTDVKRVTSKIDGPAVAVAVVVEHTLLRCLHHADSGTAVFERVRGIEGE